MNQQLTMELLIKKTKNFNEYKSRYDNTDLSGITDVKTVGTFIEYKFQDYLFI